MKHQTPNGITYHAGSNVIPWKPRPKPEPPRAVPADGTVHRVTLDVVVKRPMFEAEVAKLVAEYAYTHDGMAGDPMEFESVMPVEPEPRRR